MRSRSPRHTMPPGRVCGSTRSSLSEEGMGTGHSRRSFISLLGAFGSALPLRAMSQHGLVGVRRIGFLPGSLASLRTAFEDELQRLGYVNGGNLVIETRVARPNTSDLSAYAAELAHMDLELITVASLPVALEVRKANPAIQMVISTCPGMISNGFASSLEHPGGNSTGIEELPPGVTAKRLS